MTAHADPIFGPSCWTSSRARSRTASSLDAGAALRASIRTNAPGGTLGSARTASKISFGWGPADAVRTRIAPSTRYDSTFPPPPRFMAHQCPVTNSRASAWWRSALRGRYADPPSPRTRLGLSNSASQTPRRRRRLRDTAVDDLLEQKGIASVDVDTPGARSTWYSNRIAQTITGRH